MQPCRCIPIFWEILDFIPAFFAKKAGYRLVYSIRLSSTTAAVSRPSRRAHTTRLWPRRISPQANTLGTLVILGIGHGAALGQVYAKGFGHIGLAAGETQRQSAPDRTHGKLLTGRHHLAAAIHYPAFQLTINAPQTCPASFL